MTLPSSVKRQLSSLLALFIIVGQLIPLITYAESDGEDTAPASDLQEEQVKESPAPNIEEQTSDTAEIKPDEKMLGEQNPDSQTLAEEKDAPKISEEETPLPQSPNTATTRPKVDLSIDQSTGAAVASYPIALPPGRAGMTPSLSLQYSSQNNANDSIYGYGWDVPIPSIEQVRSYTPNELYSPHNFMLNWFGAQNEVVPVGVTTTVFADTSQKIGTKQTLPITRTTSGGILLAQKFTPHEQFINGIRLKKYGTVGTPTDNLIVGLTYDGGASPMRTNNTPFAAIALATVSPSQWNAIPDGSFFDVMFPNSIWLNTTQKSYIIIYMTGGSTPSEGYILYSNEPKAYADRFQKSDNQGNSWDDLPADLVFETLYTKTDNFGSYALKNDSGEHLAISYQSSNVWEVKDKSGTRYIFGSTVASRNDDPAAPTRIHSWLLDEIKDTRGNTIKFEYFKDKGRVYPKRILYGIYEVLFEPFASGPLAPNRLDPTISYETGFKIETRYLIYGIVIKVNGAERRRYGFWYGNGDNKKRTLLTGIQEQGKSESGVLSTLPKTTFSYQTKTPGWESAPSTSVILPPQKNFRGGMTCTTGCKYGGSFFLELNGDGLTDIYTDADNLEAFKNNNDGTFTKIPWNKPFSQRLNGSYNYNPEAILLDIDNDGLTDALAEYSAYLDNGTSGWVRAAEWDIPTNGGGDGRCMGCRVADVNGDGLMDFIYARYHSPSFDQLEDITKVVSINTGHGWEVRNDYSIPIYFSTDGQPSNYTLIDVNKDNLADIVDLVGIHGDQSTGNVYLNNGLNGWENSPSNVWHVSLGAFHPTPEPNQGLSNLSGVTHFVDVNSDGLPDIIRSYNEMYVSNTSPDPMQVREVYLNNGTNGWTRANAWDNTIPIWFTTRVLDMFPELTSKDLNTLLVDINSDGIVDIAESYYGKDPNDIVKPYDGKDYTRWHQNVYLGKGATPDVLTGITYSSGGSKTILYTLSNQYQNTRLAFPFLTVSKIQENDGMGNSSAILYSYEGGYYYADSGDAHENRFAGFHKVTTTRADGSRIVQYYHQGEGSADGNALGEYQDTIQKRGRLYREEVYEASGRKLSQTINKWDQQNQGYGVAFVFLASTVETIFDASGNRKDTAVSYTYDGYFNVISTVRYGEVIGKEDGSFTDTLSDRVTTNTAYALNTASNILSLPKYQTVYDYANVLKSDTWQYYDNLPAGSVSRGDITKKERWLDTEARHVPTTTTIYNSYGLPLSVTDPLLHTTSYVYDPHNLYPATVTNPLGHQTRFTYDYGVGAVKRVTDPNNVVSENSYDGFGRLTRVLISDENQSPTLITKTKTRYNDTIVPNSVSTYDYLSASAARPFESIAYTDGFGRVIQKRTSAETNGWYNVSTIRYDALGRIASEYLPIEQTGAGYQNTNQPESESRRFTYDALDRHVAITTSVGATTKNYNLFEETTTDANGHYKKRSADAFGRIVSVDENGVGISRSSYDALSSITSETDSEQNIRFFTYDTLSRQITNELPHRPEQTVVPYRYSYDGSGNLIQSTDPNGSVINATYDELNRTLQRDAVSTPDIDIVYKYDTAKNGVGKIASIIAIGTKEKNSPPSSVSFSFRYDLQGNLIEETQNTSIFIPQTPPASSKRLTGWSWSSSIGWIGLSCKNRETATGKTCKDIHDSSFDPTLNLVDYGVSIDGETGALSGYAWNDKIGWISFERDDAGNPPDAPYNETVSLPPSSALASHWNFDEGSAMISTRIAKDSSANGNDGILVGGQTSSDVVAGVSGTQGSALNFDGADDYVNAPSQKFIDDTQGSVSVWVRWDTLSSSRMIFSAAVDGTTDDEFYFTLNSNNALEVVLNVNRSLVMDFVTANDVITDANWHHVVITSNGTTIKVYIDAVEKTLTSVVGTNTGQWFASATDANIFTLGVIPRGTPVAYLDGAFDEARVYSQALTKEEVQTLYKTPSGNVHEGGAIAYMEGNEKDETRQVTGWARAIMGKSATESGTGSWDGWIKLSGISKDGTPYGLSLNKDTSELEGWMYGGDVIGWISANCKNRNACASASYQTNAEDIPVPPIAPKETKRTDTTSYVYDRYGAQTKITYPDQSAAEYTYNVLGKIETIKKSGSIAVSNINYAPTGAVSRMEYANGTTQSYTYDLAKLYRLARKTTTTTRAPNSPLQDISYTYDPVGNITNITDTGTELPKTSNFQYDELDRLTNAEITDTTTNVKTTESYTYSTSGNIKSKIVNGVSVAYAYDDARHPHAVTRLIGGQADTYAYDANGNMVSETRNNEAISYKYDPFNRLVKIANAAGTSSYIYGAGYDRVTKILPNGKSTVYIGEFSEANETNDFTTHLFADTMRIATSDKTGTYYNVGDHLGSSSLALDAAGAVVQKLDYLPFGGERVNVKTGAFDTKFTYTDQERDDESGLMYYGARYYHPGIGRFTQPDPVIIDTGRREFRMALANPQLLNGYAYVGNNPIKNTDTEGEFIDTIWDVGSVGYDFGKLALGFGKGFVGGITDNKTMMDSADALIRGATIDVGADVGATFIPFVPAGTTKAIRAADKAKDAVKAVKGAEKVVDAKNAVRIWPGPEGGRKIVNGIEYTEHALARMAPKGHEWIEKSGKIIEGRGIPTTVVENALQFGKKIIQKSGKEIEHIYENVRVLTNETLERVISVRQQTIKGKEVLKR